MKEIITFFVKNYKFSFFVTLLVAVSGIKGLSVLQRESRPPVDFAMSVIKTIYPGSSPEEVQEKVTRKIEDELRTVSGLKDVKSVSQSGLSTINIRIDMDHFNVKEVQNEIQQALQRVSDLPPEILSEPELTHMKADEIPIVEIVLSGSNDNRQRDVFADNLKKILEDNKGVSEVRLTGFRQREYQVLLDPQKMQDEFVSIKEVVDALKARVQDIPAGFLQSADDRSLVTVRGQIDEAKELENVIIRANFNGRKILVKDVAVVADGAQDPSVLVRLNGQPATLVTVIKKGQSDGITTVNELLKSLEAYKTVLPEGYSLHVFKNEAEEIERRLGIVYSNAWAGLVLVLIVLLIFLPGVLGVSSSLSLPLAVLGSLAMMPVIGANFNNVTMLAIIICLGMLVDNSVVISENYAKHRTDGLSPVDASVKAAHQFWVPILGTALTTIAAFLPMLFTKGIMGEFIKWIPIVVTIALLISLFESYWLLPARLQFTVKKIKNTSRKDWFEPIKVSFMRLIALCVRRRYVVSLLIVLMLVSSAFITYYGNRFELFPKVGVENYIARFEAKIGTDIYKTDSLIEDLSKQVYDVLGKDIVKDVLAYSGVQRAGLRDPDEKNDVYAGMLNISIFPDKALQLQTESVLAQLREKIPLGKFINLTFEALGNGPPVGTALNVTFRSDDYEKLKEVIAQFKKEVQKIKGVISLKDDEISGGKEYRFDLNHINLARVGLDTQKVGEALRTALEGNIVTELDKNATTFDLRVRFTDSNRGNLDALKKIKIMTETGSLIPITEVTTIREMDGPFIRKHFDFKRSITVSADVIPTEITSVTLNNKAKKITNTLTKTHPSVSVVFGGEEESTKESVESLVGAMELAALGIFAILVFLFSSYSKSFIVLSTIPLGLIGVAWAFYFHQRPLSFFSLIGVVGLAGVVVNSAIILMSYIDELKAETNLPYHEVLVLASADRLRAVLVTSLTTLGGLFPTAYGIGGSDTILIPMTLALAWGLAGGTFLTLIWVPCAAAILDDTAKLGQKLLGKFQRSKKTV